MLPLRYGLIVAVVAMTAIFFAINWDISSHDGGFLQSLSDRLHSIGSSFKGSAGSSNQTTSHADDEEIDYGDHEIAQRFRRGGIQVKQILAEDSETLHDAAQRYRSRRGRHPPPRFDEWFQFAKERNAIVSEQMFDQIYEDLDPFWGMDSAEIRDKSTKWPHRIVFRKGKSSRMSPWKSLSFLDTWANMMDNLGRRLPDMDLAVNMNDEPYVIAPRRQIDNLMSIGLQFRTVEPPGPNNNYTSSYQPWTKVSVELQDPPEDVDFMKIESAQRMWMVVRDACPLGSPVDTLEMPDGFLEKIPFRSTETTNYVTNWTDAKSVCTNPDIRLHHGAFVAPNVKQVIKTLFPLFSACKMQGINNDILLPAAINWVFDERVQMPTEETAPWANKTGQAIWRGTATGGEHTAANWRAFQRHRLVTIMNATQVWFRELDAHREWEPAPDDHMPVIDKAQVLETFPMPPPDFEPMLAPQNPNFPGGRNPKPGRLSAWTKRVGNAAFTHFYCDPKRLYAPPGECEYMEPYFSVAPSMPIEHQLANYKFLPDVDGQSMSGRYRGFLLANSVAIKATVFAEWHDSRLVPWRHFVPMHNSFADWWGIMGYLAGDKRREMRAERLRLKAFVEAQGGVTPDHEAWMDEGLEDADDGNDAMARSIAEQGAQWVRRVMRKEDMLVYVYRLLLEYARLASEERVRMAFVDDLVDDN